ncbi:NUDIX hydrolase [Litchfieldia alkalitelluris]|uniref:NUDIX hydrolase n=1 Tax=Litchfieldia alkalitelluris TaxID=304268 RepID=UPI000996D3C5|nr:NUDIX hydrolase [Litchfieldia alkalitelluris]
MISQAIIIKDNKLLMVKQYVQRGDIVWNFPGGGIERNETPEQACIREVKEETGFNVQITKLLYENEKKYSFLAEIIGGSLKLDKNLVGNEDLVEVKWISLLDTEKFDNYTKPILDIYKSDVN